MIILQHLSHPTQKLLEEYYLLKKQEIQYQLEYNWCNAAGVDISHILRGKIQVIDEILNLRNIFDDMDKFENKLKGANK